MHQLMIKSLVGLFIILLATPILTISFTSKDELPNSSRSEHFKDQQGDLYRSTGIINNAENLSHQTITTETEESNDVDLISSRSSADRELKEVQVLRKAASGGGRPGSGGGTSATRPSGKNQASSLVMPPLAFVSIGLISLLSYLF